MSSLTTILLASLLLSLAPPARAHDGVNAVAGDRSWIERNGARPGPLASEDERIATHLAWIEARLRAAPIDHLGVTQRRARLALLDELRAYTVARVFPRRHDGVPGRRPRFVDTEGRHCAVAHLVRVSAGPRLVRLVLAAHADDYVPDMRVPALAAWADRSGFTIAELALIQPTYDDGTGPEMPPEESYRERAARRRREAREPRDLTVGHVQHILRAYAGWFVSSECVGDRVGRYRLRTTLEVSRAGRVRGAVEIHERDGERVGGRALERCFRRAAERAMSSFIESANHRFPTRIREEHEQPLDAYSAEEVEAAFVADERHWNPNQTRAEARAECMREWPAAELPVRVPVEVLGHNGEVRIRWTAYGPAPRFTAEEGPRWHCLDRTLTLGALPEHGLRSRAFVVEIARDGSLRVVPDDATAPW